MDTIMLFGMYETTETIQCPPAVSIIMPFQPKMTCKEALKHSLELAAEEVEQLISEHYPGEMGLLVVQKLRGVIRDVNYNTHRNSIAIYISPLMEKVLYL